MIPVLLVTLHWAKDKNVEPLTAPSVIHSEPIACVIYKANVQLHLHNQTRVGLFTVVTQLRRFKEWKPLYF